MRMLSIVIVTLMLADFCAFAQEQPSPSKNALSNDGTKEAAADPQRKKQGGIGSDGQNPSSANSAKSATVAQQDKPAPNNSLEGRDIRSVSSVSNWLKDTLGGIIVLGAVGSILAVVILKIISHTAKKSLPGVARSVKRHFAVNRRASRLVFEELKRRRDTRGLIAAYALLQSRLMFYEMTAICFAALLMASYSVSSLSDSDTPVVLIYRLVCVTMITLLLVLFHVQRSIVADAFDLFVGSIDSTATATAESEFDAEPGIARPD